MNDKTEEQNYIDIARSIEDGSYYEDAQDWYNIKYLYPVVERTFFIFLTSISVICSVIAAFILYSFLPLTTHIPVAVSNNDPVSQYTAISKMTKDVGYSDADGVVQKYLIRKYVESYEEYDYQNNFAKMSANSNFISSFSNDYIKNTYAFFSSLRNPESFRLKYREHTLREIKVEDAQIRIEKSTPETKKHTDKEGNVIEYPQFNNTAFITFNSIETNKNGVNITKWKARIDYAYNAITFIRSKKNFLPLYFQVEDYQSTEIK